MVLIINKVPREFELQDLPALFPRIKDLRLYHLENPEKLKMGISRAIIPEQRSKDDPRIGSDFKVKKQEKYSIQYSSEDYSSHKHKKHHKENKKKHKRSKYSSSEELDFDLGEDSDSEEMSLPFNSSYDSDNEEYSFDSDEEIPTKHRSKEFSGTQNIEPELTEHEKMLARMSPEERVRYEKEEYLWKFRILKKVHPTRVFSEYNEHSDLQMMKSDYERTIKMISLDDSVDSYRAYLTMSFFALEFISTRWLGIDLGGFAKAQVSSMDKYERLLIELGEKRRETWTSNLPVEVRLLGMVLLQAMIFYITKSLGDNLFGGIFNQNKTTQPQRNENTQNTEQPKRKMRGPSIELSEE